ncbi:MAG: hypothetical protein AAF648_14680 [Pseudomonadota bacterium]
MSTELGSDDPGALEGNGCVDLLEIFHARRLRRSARMQVERLLERQRGAVYRSDADNFAELASYYEALALSLDDLLMALGDRVAAND